MGGPHPTQANADASAKPTFAMRPLDRFVFSFPKNTVATYRAIRRIRNVLMLVIETPSATKKRT
jgi:hypothetical protein